MKPEANKQQAPTPVGSGDLLGRRRIGESCDDSARPAFREINNLGTQLAEMLDYPGPMAVLIESFKRQGVRFDESDLLDSDITHNNQYVAIIGGKTAEFLSRLQERLESGATAQEALEYARLLFRSPDFGLVNVIHLGAIHKSNNHSLPNEKS